MGFTLLRFAGFIEGDRVGEARPERSGASLHYYRQWSKARGGEAWLPSERDGTALRCGVRGAFRREASRTCVQAVARRARVSSERETNF